MKMHEKSSVSDAVQDGNGASVAVAPAKKPSLYRRLLRPSAKYSVLTLLVLGFVVGAFFWGGFNTALEATNTEAFCISCHEMRDNVYPEYKQSVHYATRSGMQVVCANCHVPHALVPKLIRKIQAANEVWGKLTGTIATPEKFEARRLQLARIEWARMKASDSRECRNCHTQERMNPELQKVRSRKMHELGAKDGSTCIDCHKGIAHHKPQGMTKADEE